MRSSGPRTAHGRGVRFAKLLLSSSGGEETGLLPPQALGENAIVKRTCFLFNHRINSINFPGLWQGHLS